MSVEATNALTIRRTINAPLEAVWRAWTEPDQVRVWSCPVPGGVRRFEADLRVGGAYVLAMEIEGEPHTAIGRYREVDPPHRLVYTWDWKEHPIGETVVTLELEERDGATVVNLTHEGFGDVAATRDHEEGWTACIGHLEALFGG